RMPSSSSTSMTWIWERPLAPPPPKATAKDGPAGNACSMAAVAAGGGDESWPGCIPAASLLRFRPKHHDCGLGLKQTARGREDLLPRHCVYQFHATVDIVDPEILALQV